MEEKKGDVLNQLAIIVDLIEKINLNYNRSRLFFYLNEKDFENFYNYSIRKYGEEYKPLKKDVNEFNIMIGDVEITINKSNV